MNPLAKTFNFNPKNSHLLHADPLTKIERNILQEIIREWTEIPTLDLLLEHWTNHRTKMLSMSNVQQNLSVLLLNVSSLNRYMIELFHLIDSAPAPIVILNGTHHEEEAVKRFTTHFFNYNVFTNKGTNAFGGVLIAVHKSIRCQRKNKFDDIPNLLVIETGPASESYQLATCYSPPREAIPLDIFDRLLSDNPNTIFTGDLNAKHQSWSSSLENQKGRALHDWLLSSFTQTPLDVINKHIPTSTRSKATIDLIIAPEHLSSSFTVLSSIGNDHHPIVWYPTFKLPSTHELRPIKCSRWKLFEIFLTFTTSFWKSLATTMGNSTTFFTLYERFLSLCASRFTTISFVKAIKPSLPQELIKMIEQKRIILKQFRRTRHPFFAVVLRDASKLIQKLIFKHKRETWLIYCKTFNQCDTKAFWSKMKRHFNFRAPPIEGFTVNNKIISLPM